MRSSGPTALNLRNYRCEFPTPMIFTLKCTSICTDIVDRLPTKTGDVKKRIEILEERHVK